MTRMDRRTLILLLSSLPLAACGGDDGDGDNGGGSNFCGFGNDDYLPYQAGFSWTYRVTDLGTGVRTSKEQSIEPEIEHPDFGAVLVQVTSKPNGETVSHLRREGDRVLRFQQEDYDSARTLERTTVYEPPQIRIDESTERIAAGAEWDENYTETITDPGLGLVEIPTTDHWEVLALDAPCESPAGTFECIRLRRTRTAGGVAQKEFHFARGIGKVREVGGNQLEELMACAPDM
jgi:hypothetical protein